MDLIVCYSILFEQLSEAHLLYTGHRITHVRLEHRILLPCMYVFYKPCYVSTIKEEIQCEQNLDKKTHECRGIIEYRGVCNALLYQFTVDVIVTRKTFHSWLYMAGYSCQLIIWVMHHLL